jgi:hypothetical protein
MVPITERSEINSTPRAERNKEEDDWELGIRRPQIQELDVENDPNFDEIINLFQQ